MSLATKLLSASGGGASPLYVDDVFSAYTYTGNGSIQTITNGIDLAGKGGMVWIKSRTSAAHPHIYDTNRGANKYILPTGTAAEATGTAMGLFNSSGFRVEGGVVNTNGSGANYASWTFRKAPKFFDVVTYTGNGSNPRSISHSLGAAPGMLIIKRTDSTGSWWVYHRGITLDQTLLLETTAAAAANPGVWDTGPTSSIFTVNAGAFNTNGAAYVAYLFAHDTSADGIVQCGSFTTNGSGMATVNLGWEPQFLTVKNTTGVSDNWYTFDSSRGWNMSGSDASLNPNLSASENTLNIGNPTATGFIASSFTASTTYIYLAIRRPNRPPTTGTQVYNAIARTGTGAAATVTGVGFAPDLIFNCPRGGGYTRAMSRLVGNSMITPGATVAEQAVPVDSFVSYDMSGMTVGPDAVNYVTNFAGVSFIHHFFKRAPGVFDQVCYTGTGVAGYTVTHGLGVAPELMIIKRRDITGTWRVYAAPVGATHVGQLNSTGAFGFSELWWNNTSPTASLFTLGEAGDVNNGTATFVAYLFASKAGISKVGSYTGNGTSQTINAGFTTGARFVMIKRTDSTGDWYVWDTVRGLVAGNDPHLSLNTTAAEVTTNDSLDPANAGFIVNQLAATNINVTSATYIYLAFA